MDPKDYEITDREYSDQKERNEFGKQFTKALEEWLSIRNEDGSRRSQNQFCELVGDKLSAVSDDPDGRSLHPNMIKRYKDGKALPRTTTYVAICKVLGKSADYFTFNYSPEEIYQHSSEYQNEFGSRMIDYCQEIGINMDLFSAIRDLVPFSETFPYYVPISFVGSGKINDPERKESDFRFERKRDPAPASEMEDQSGKYLQMNLNGKTVDLTFEDLDFIKEIQDEIVQTITKKFEDRRRKYDEEVEDQNATLKNMFENKQFGKIFDQLFGIASGDSSVIEETEEAGIITTSIKKKEG